MILIRYDTTVDIMVFFFDPSTALRDPKMRSEILGDRLAERSRSPQLLMIRFFSGALQER